MINLKHIKNIIFDLGGVILNIDYNLTANEFKKLGFDDYNNLFSKLSQQKIFDLLETGKITDDYFFASLKKLSNKTISNDDIIYAWNAMLLDFPKERIEVLKKLKPKYRTFLLSNTNQIHLDAYNKTLKKNFGINNLSSVLEKEYYSHIVGMRKPDIEIFKLVLTENNLIPNETLFIDDSPQHIEAANKLGIISYHLTNNKTICDLFNK